MTWSLDPIEYNHSNRETLEGKILPGFEKLLELGHGGLSAEGLRSMMSLHVKV